MARPLWLIRRAPIGAIVLILFLALSFGGGATNRLRGSGKVDPHHELGHDVAERLAYAIPTGVLVCALTGNWFLGVWMLFGSWATLMIGWGVYMDIGKHTEAHSRSGVFDWLIAREETPWTHSDMWLHDFTGMSLRGLAWTLPTGAPLWYFGYGWLYMLSGVAQGSVYYIAAHISSHTKNLRTGTGLAEFLWGWYLWCALILSLLVNRSRFFTLQPPMIPRGSTAQDTLPDLEVDEEELDGEDMWCVPRFQYAMPGFPATVRRPMCSRETSPTAVNVLVACQAWLCFIFLGSVVEYARVRQTDHRNKRESWAGLMVALLATALPLLGYLFWRCYTQRALRYHGFTPVYGRRASYSPARRGRYGRGAPTHTRVPSTSGGRKAADTAPSIPDADKPLKYAMLEDDLEDIMSDGGGGGDHWDRRPQIGAIGHGTGAVGVDLPFYVATLKQMHRWTYLPWCRPTERTMSYGRRRGRAGWWWRCSVPPVLVILWYLWAAVTVLLTVLAAGPLPLYLLFDKRIHQPCWMQNC